MALINGYPDSVGGKRHSVITVRGPVSYTTGGFIVQALSLGLSHFDYISAIADDAGIEFAVGSFPNASSVPATQAFVQVYTSSTGAEVVGGTNLSSRTFRVYGLGL